ncbi:GtrA family protein [Tomitella fengzijianii]|uniref:GtrA family protein n=2 Tax=Tomitella fengzijianii TaxID=2597660 RepID=A0A516X7A5_9ACTN|nr:GtrA family protein [Tomitella fengzijianii]
MPAEIPVTDNVGATDLGLKTQMVRFIITGALSGIVDFGLTVLLMQFGMGHTPAKAVGFICGTTTAYLINRRWTFQAPPSTARFIAVAVLYAVTFVVQVGLFDVMFRVLPEGIIYTFIAYCVAQGTATVINFVVQRVVIFNIK